MIIGFQVTVENVGDVFLRHSVVAGSLIQTRGLSLVF